MIRIHKPKEEPEVLRKRGRKKCGTMKSRYTRFSDDFDKGEKKFDFNSGIYGRSSVKEALIDAQYGKCAFCESKVTHVAPGDVEHFRPKKGYRQRKGDPLGRPGYYWLAYEWSNLLFACEICNRRHKRNLFPLQNPSQRARSHHDNYRREKPLFIHPAEEDPAQFIEFHKHEVVALHPRGAVTIVALGLDRPELDVRREKRYEILESLYDLAILNIPQSEKARRLLEESAQNRSEYAAMARAALKAGFSA